MCLTPPGSLCFQKVSGSKRFEEEILVCITAGKLKEVLAAGELEVCSVGDKFLSYMLLREIPLK